MEVGRGKGGRRQREVGKREGGVKGKLGKGKN